jgi:hypothetical protein
LVFVHDSIPPFPALREYIRFPRFADHPNDYQVIVNHIQAVVDSVKSNT